MPPPAFPYPSLCDALRGPGSVSSSLGVMATADPAASTAGMQANYSDMPLYGGTAGRPSGTSEACRSQKPQDGSGTRPQEHLKTYAHVVLDRNEVDYEALLDSVDTRDRKARRMAGLPFSATAP